MMCFSIICLLKADLISDIVYSDSMCVSVFVCACACVLVTCIQLQVTRGSVACTARLPDDNRHTQARNERSHSHRSRYIHQLLLAT